MNFEFRSVFLLSFLEIDKFSSLVIESEFLKQCGSISLFILGCGIAIWISFRLKLIIHVSFKFLDVGFDCMFEIYQ